VTAFSVGGYELSFRAGSATTSGPFLPDQALGPPRIARRSACGATLVESADDGVAFRDNDVDDLVLRSLTADDLKEMGVRSVGHRRKLLDAIMTLALCALRYLRPTLLPTQACFWRIVV
jgi:SAM domain (Sterile alpha motif)